MSRRIAQIAGLALVLFIVFALGIMAGSQTAPAAAGAGTEQTQDAEAGLLIASVDPDGAAAEAGVVRGDILLSLNDTEVNSQRDLISALDDLEPGDEVRLTVLHGDDRRTLTATLSERDGQAYLGVVPCGFPAGSVAERVIVDALRGATLVKVVPDSPADDAGLKVGDRIVAIDGEALDEDSNLADAIAAHAPGDRVVLTIERPSEESREVTVTLGEHPEESGKAYLGVEYLPLPRVHVFGDGAEPFRFRFGKGIPLPLEIPDLEGVETGAVVVDVAEGSPAQTAGLRDGDVITAIEGEPLPALSDVREAVAARKPGDTLRLTVHRSGEAEAIEVTATLGESPDNPGEAYLGVRIGGFFFHKSEGVIPDQFRGVIPHFEFSLPFFDDSPSWECPCPDETPEAPDTSTTL